MQKSLQSEDDRRLQKAENWQNEVRWVHLQPWNRFKAVLGISMHPAVLMAISDFEIYLDVERPDHITESCGVISKFKILVVFKSYVFYYEWSYMLF